MNYTWDNNGDLTNRGSDTFSWDYEDRMTSATLTSGAGGVSSYSYDNANRLTAISHVINLNPIRPGLERLQAQVRA